MISLYEISEFSKKSLHNPIETDENITDDIFIKLSPLHEKLINSLKSETNGEKSYTEKIVDDGLLFVALPEFLFTKISEVINSSNYKKGKDDEIKKINQDLGINIKKEQINYFNYTQNAESKCFWNIENSDKVTGILMCHGLSPIKDDSILLLADIGRLSRSALILELEITAMLADTSWMSYNLSSYQIEGLNDEDKENNLNACLSKRQNLYQNLGIKCEIKSIRHQETDKLKYGEVNKSDIDNISNEYVELAKCLFGDGIMEIVKDPNKKKVIEQDLNSIKSPLTKPKFIETFSKFPNIVSTLEETLAPHLTLMRKVALNFNSLESGRFTYFTTQYFAQRDYKGEFLKIAPESEAKFDIPFENLTECFEEWIADNKFINKNVSNLKVEHRNSKLSAIYLPHYYFTKNYTLPYTPASGDIIIKYKDIDKIEDNVILLNDKKTITEIAEILSYTPIYHRNRLLADIVSFMLYSSLKAKETPEGIISNSVNEVDFGTFDEILEGINPFFKLMYHREKKIYQEGGLKKAWATWLKVLDQKNVQYIPIHICFLLLDEDDWRDETKKLNLAKIIRIAIKLSHKLR